MYTFVALASRCEGGRWRGGEGVGVKGFMTLSNTVLRGVARVLRVIAERGNSISGYLSGIYIQNISAPTDDDPSLSIRTIQAKM